MARLINISGYESGLLIIAEGFFDAMNLSEKSMHVLENILQIPGNLLADLSPSTAIFRKCNQEKNSWNPDSILFKES